MTGPSLRNSRFGALATLLLVAGSAAGVIGWYVVSNRAGPAVDSTGFDLNEVSRSGQPVAPPAPLGPPSPGTPRSGLDMMRADPNVRFGDAGPAGGRGGPGSARPLDKTEEAHLGFTEAARKYESLVNAFSLRMTRKYPVIRQYGRDWMSYPDLRKLNDDYARDHDPVAFLVGLSRAPNFGKIVRKYAGSPEIREFIVEGVKEAPGELTSAALQVLQTDGLAKKVVSNAVSGLGLPPSVAMMIGNDPANVDPNQVAREILKNPPPQSPH